jgi:hypothetical protein
MYQKIYRENTRRNNAFSEISQILARELVGWTSDLELETIQYPMVSPNSTNNTSSMEKALYG